MKKLHLVSFANLKIYLLIIFLWLGFSSKGQTEDISKIALEIRGESIVLLSLSTPKGGLKLFYSEDKKMMVTQNDPGFATDKSLLIVKPLIRVFKRSDIYPDNNALSIIMQMSKIVNGVEIRTSFDLPHNVTFAKVNKWTRTQDLLSHTFELGDINDINNTLTLALKPSGSFCTYSSSMQKTVYQALLMKDIELTIIEGKRVKNSGSN